MYWWLHATWQFENPGSSSGFGEGASSFAGGNVSITSPLNGSGFVGNGWNTDGYYEHGKFYLNTITHQMRFLIPHLNEIGTTLFTQNLVGNMLFTPWLEQTSFTLGLGGNIFSALENMTVSRGYWLGKNGMYYKISWGGNQWTGGRSGSFKTAKLYKKAGMATTIIGGSIDIGLGIYEDSKAQGHLSIGHNSGAAVASVAGGAGGASIGSMIGGAIGAHFGGIGAIPGSAIGGFIGGWIGGWGGSNAGEAIYNSFVY